LSFDDVSLHLNCLFLTNIYIYRFLDIGRFYVFIVTGKVFGWG